MAIGCCVGAGKTLFILINIVYFTQGFSLLVVGAAIKINIIPVDVFSLLNTLQIVGLALGNILNIIYILIIVMGSLMTLSAIMGMCGAFYESKCCITIYLILLVVMLCAMIPVAVLWFNITEVFTLDTKIRLLRNLLHGNMITDSLKTFGDVISTGINPSSLTFGCCDTEPVADTRSSFEQTPWCVLSGNCQQAHLPKTCCHGPKLFNIEILPSVTCPTSEEINTLDVKGCFDELEKLIQMYSKSIFGNSVAVMSTQVVAIVLAGVLCQHIGREALPI
ncbi:tetraspanin-18-like isoform X1 [Crassostrea virginica]